MKRLIKLMVAVVMMLTTVGCSGDSPKSGYDALTDKGYTLLVGFDLNNFYDEKGNCYDADGEMID